jgi:hypothetical protein
VEQFQAGLQKGMSSNSSASSVGLQGVLLGPDAHILDGMKSADFSQRTKAFDEASALLASGKIGA